MARDKKGAYNLNVVLLTLVAVVLFAAIAALGINLIGVSIFAPASSALFVAASAPQATPTIAEDNLTPIGFGTPAVPIPTFDVSQIDKLPTTVPPPDLPTLIPTPPAEGEAPLSGKIEIITHDGT